jgi:ribosomal protein L39E
MLQAARDKKRWARSCRQVRFIPAPISIPVTVRSRVQATSPVVIAQNIGKVADEKQRRKWASSNCQVAATGGCGSIGGDPSAEAGSIGTADVSACQGDIRCE